jgi:hypothetical protein
MPKTHLFGLFKLLKVLCIFVCNIFNFGVNNLINIVALYNVIIFKFLLISSVRAFSLLLNFPAFLWQLVIAFEFLFFLNFPGFYELLY